MIRIMLVDDHPVVRQGLRVILEAETGWYVVGEATDGLSAVEMAERIRPDVALIDVMLPDLNGLEVVRRVVRQRKQIRVVVLSMHADISYVAEALDSGASAYVLKATDTSNLVEAVQAVLTGHKYLSPPLVEKQVEDYRSRANTANQPVDRYRLLTRREREVLQLVVQGLTNNQIGDRLSISPRTVETHRANLMRKLKFQTTAELLHYAHQRGLTGAV